MNKKPDCQNELHDFYFDEMLDVQDSICRRIKYENEKWYFQLDNNQWEEFEQKLNIDTLNKGYKEWLFNKKMREMLVEDDSRVPKEGA